MIDWMNSSKKKIDLALIFVILIFTVALRFPFLGYSDYIGDEHKAFIEPIPGQTTVNFFLSRRKGPMQFLVSAIPRLFVGHFKNEFAQRLPFTVLGTAAVLVFYYLVKELTLSKTTAFIAALLLSVNGLIVGFARIAQYQNLNLFFSFLALFFYAKMLTPGKRVLFHSLCGTCMYCLSLLSHWDAIFILPPMVFIFLRFLLEKENTSCSKKKLLIYNFVWGCVLLLPFLVPYVAYQLGDAANKAYFARRVEFGQINFDRYKLIFDLYNPFFTFPFLVVFGLIGAFFAGKNSLYLIWFVVTYGIFDLFVRKPGTHIYNFVIPLIILAAVGITQVVELFPKWWKVIPALIATLSISFLFYQSYIVFVDHSVEYPWYQEKIVGYETRRYTEKEKLPLFGFPHDRKWQEVNEFINSQDTDYKYITNEVLTISEWYLDVDHGIDGGFYAVGVKKPLSFVNDYKFTNIGGKKHLHSIRNDEGKTVVKIYVVE
jgi:4-amino-4-deoxy-L-arabinose transferase-like glycosyltransferase